MTFQGRIDLGNIPLDHGKVFCLEAAGRGGNKRWRRITEGVVVRNINPKVSMIGGATRVEGGITTGCRADVGQGKNAINRAVARVFIEGGRGQLMRVGGENDFSHIKGGEYCSCAAMANILIGVNANNDMITH
jgi:hypothetical protein